jgi:hypothetical protein
VSSPIWGSWPERRGREDGSVFCICRWSSPAHSFSGPSPLDLATIFCCLSFETSLFVASYDSQGHGGGIRPRFHTGMKFCCYFTLYKNCNGKLVSNGGMIFAPSLMKIYQLIQSPVPSHSTLQHCTRIKKDEKPISSLRTSRAFPSNKGGQNMKLTIQVTKNEWISKQSRRIWTWLLWNW